MDEWDSRVCSNPSVLLEQFDNDIKLQFEMLYNRLIEFNTKINITGIVTKPSVYVKHFADSLLTLDLLESNANIIDIGCGAGFPSIPLAIVRKDLRFTLVDSVDKKLKFVRNIAVELGLNNITVMHSRAEDLQLREHFDYGLARAVANLSTLVEYIVPFIKVGGLMLAYKSNVIDVELNEADHAINSLNCKVIDVKEYEIAFTDIRRKIVIIKKHKSSDIRYPRGQNKPRLNPL